MKKKERLLRFGFTSIEILIVIVIIALLAGISIVNLAGRRSRTELIGTTQQIVALLREAQSRSVNQASSSSWGVHLENSTATSPFYALFANSYSSSTHIGYYRLSRMVQYATSSLSLGSSTDVMFSQLNGVPLASTSITLELVSGGGPASMSSTIRVNMNGSVEY